MKTHIDYLKNFGSEGETTVIESGINGKMSEFNSALGLLQLKYIDDLIEQRKHIAHTYRLRLQGVTGVQIVGPFDQKRANYSYFPILITDEYRMSRDELYESLKSIGIYSRRYFYPLISEFPMYQNFTSSNKANHPVAFKCSNQILCLPIFPGIQSPVIEKACSFISGA